MDARDLPPGFKNRILRNRGRLFAWASLWLIGSFFFPTDKADDLYFILKRRIGDHNMHQKPVHLRFGQRIGAFLLDWVLGGHDHE